ncbi:succinyldiaminopimelate aminotransferase [Achromatium sp. WMS2]|nr:succinyldiaminopimelate aminotransferase [Achromatium sp. WMS2]
MNKNISRLQPYPFTKLNQLLAGIQPPAHLSPIILSIGEPKHPTPQLITNALVNNLSTLASYPLTRGLNELRTAIANWLIWRFALPNAGIDPNTQVLPVNGTREALFAFAQTVIDVNTNANSKAKPLVLLPNPFYQIYEGAALLAGATPHFLPCTVNTGFVPDFTQVADAVWEQCQLLYICSPANPTGAILDLPTLKYLIGLADKFDFIIAADECYSEIYQDESNPPPGLLQAAAELGRTDYGRCVVFHSLSKRSNCPGLRSGFVAGDATILEKFLLYRTYHGCAMSLPTQYSSIAAWTDENHVIKNRTLYREKFAAMRDILQPVLPITVPSAGFYLWLPTSDSDTKFTAGLFANTNLTVLPGSFLSRDHLGFNPGHNYVRVALTPPLAECVEAARRMREHLESSIAK